MTPDYPDTMFGAGAAEVSITPNVGIPLAGYFVPRPSTGVLDELMCKALVVSDGTTSAAIVSCDLLCIESGSVSRIRQLANKATGIPAPNILISCTHCHTGPYTVRLPDQQSREFLDTIERRIAACIVDAHSDMSEASLSAGCGDLSGVAFIRRFVMSDGSVRTNPGVGNPEIDRPIGEVDSSLITALLRRPDNSPVAAIVNFALHADTTGGTEISADYPGHLSRTVKDQLGSGVPVLCLNGACGDVNHFDVKGPSRQTGPDCSKAIGSKIGMRALEIMAASHLIPGAPLSVTSTVLELPYREIASSDVEEARRVVDQVEADPESVSPIYTTEDLNQSLSARYNFARQLLRVYEASHQQPFVETELQRVSIGGLRILAAPAEIFAETGMRLKACEGPSLCMVATCANGMLGYVPPSKAFDEGGYETKLGEGSKMATGAEAEIVDAFAKLAGGGSPARYS